MALIISFSPEEEALLHDRAKLQGTSLEMLVREAVGHLLADYPRHSEAAQPTRSLYGLLREYGPGPSEEEIEENRREMFANFGRDDIA